MPESEALTQAAKLLSRRMMSHSMLRARMLRKGFDEAQTQEALDFLVCQGYLDDQAFADAYVRDQKNLRHKGPLRIRNELKGHGVDPDQVEKALATNYPEPEQMEQARILVQKWTEARKKTEAKKLMARLYRKGFPPAMARTVVERVCGE